MNAFKQILGLLLCFAAIAVGIGFALPAAWEVSRDVTIQAPPGDVHAVVDALDTWKNWSQYGFRVDPAVRMETGETAKGVDARLTWDGPKVGEGSLKVTASEHDRGLWFDLSLRGGREELKGVFQYEPQRSGATIVRLTLRSNAGTNIFGRYLGFARRYGLGRELAETLTRLKRRVETGA